MTLQNSDTPSNQGNNPQDPSPSSDLLAEYKDRLHEVNAYLAKADLCLSTLSRLPKSEISTLILTGVQEGLMRYQAYFTLATHTLSQGQDLSIIEFEHPSPLRSNYPKMSAYLADLDKKAEEMYIVSLFLNKGTPRKDAEELLSRRREGKLIGIVDGFYRSLPHERI